MSLIEGGNHKHNSSQYLENGSRHASSTTQSIIINDLFGLIQLWFKNWSGQANSIGRVHHC